MLGMCRIDYLSNDIFLPLVLDRREGTAACKQGLSLHKMRAPQKFNLRRLKRKGEEQEVCHETLKWVVSYADLVTNSN